MIVKIKTFSGETLYIPEEDYLNEVMYSSAARRALTKPGKTATLIKQTAEKGTPRWREALTYTSDALMNGDRETKIKAGTEVSKVISKGKGGFVRKGSSGKVVRTDVADDIRAHRQKLEDQMKNITPARNTERIAQKRADNQARLRQEQNPIARYFMN